MDVSRDQLAAQEMVRRTGQMGVPVTVLDGQAVVGFDRSRLEALIAARAGRAPAHAPFGAAVKAVAGGVLVGRVRSGSSAEKSGLRAGDVIATVGEQPVSDAESLSAALGAAGTGALLRVTRDGQQLVLSAGS